MVHPSIATPSGAENASVSPQELSVGEAVDDIVDFELASRQAFDEIRPLGETAVQEVVYYQFVRSESGWASVKRERVAGPMIAQKPDPDLRRALVEQAEQLEIPVDSHFRRLTFVGSTGKYITTEVLDLDKANDFSNPPTVK